MLSVLIPTYNYNAFPLVKEIHEQCENAKIDYEIIVLDDGSTQENSLEENRKINLLSKSLFEENKCNIGRAGIRNLLAKKARFEWLLFMDSDTFPKNKNFITNYIVAFTQNNNYVHFGGICYKNEPPEQAQLLRWKYGKKREEISFKIRLKNPYNTALISNIIIHKSILNSIPFDQRIIEYGYEDLVFITQLKAKNITINQINNPTYHLNYETSKAFLNKTKKALETLKYIDENKILNSLESKIQKAYRLISLLKLNRTVSFLFISFQTKAEKNLLSSNPYLLVFDLYKLGYFCYIKNK